MMRVGAATKPPRIKKPSLLRGGFRGYVPTDADRAASIAVRRHRAQQRATDLMPVINDQESWDHQRGRDRSWVD